MRKDYFELTYKLRIREISAFVIGVLVILFYLFPKIIESQIIFEESEFTEILNVEIVKPLQQQEQFKSARPSIPIEADEESDIDTLDFMDTDIEGFGDWGAPPPPPTSNNRPNGFNMIRLPLQKKHCDRNILIYVNRLVLKEL